MNTLFFIISLFVANPNLDEEYTPYDLYEGITTCIRIYLVYKFISSIYEESKNKDNNKDEKSKTSNNYTIEEYEDYYNDINNNEYSGSFKKWLKNNK